MALFDEQLKLLQERTALTTQQEAVQKAKSDKTQSDTKAAQTGPVAFIRGMEQMEARQRAQEARKSSSADKDTEALLSNIQAENDYLRNMETQLKQREEAMTKRQQVASAGASALVEYSSGSKSLEDVNRALTAALGQEGALVKYNPDSMQVQAFNPDGQLSLTATLPQLLTAAGYDNTQIGPMIAQISGTAVPTAEFAGEVAASQKVAEAQGITKGIGGTERDTRIGLGLEKPVQQTQEVPYAGGPVPQAITQRSGGVIQDPLQLQRANKLNEPLYMKSMQQANEQATNSAGVAANMQGVLDLLNDPANKGKSLSGFGQQLRNTIDNIGAEFELEKFKPNISSQEIQARITDAAVGRMKDLGGNDSQQELERIESIAGTLGDPEQVLQAKATAVRGAAFKLSKKAEFLNAFAEYNPALISNAESAYSNAVRSIDPRQTPEQIEQQLVQFLDPNFRPALNQSGFMKTTPAKQPVTTTQGATDFNDLP